MGSNAGDMSPLEVEVRKSQYAAQIMADNDRLTERVAELEADQRRLEWIVSEVLEFNRPMFSLLAVGNWREAIDEAMRGE